MTKQQALKEAKRRWGPDADARTIANGGRIGHHGEFVRTIGNIRGLPN